jgi:hypothetical protein
MNEASRRRSDAFSLSMKLRDKSGPWGGSAAPYLSKKNLVVNSLPVDAGIRWLDEDIEGRLHSAGAASRLTALLPTQMLRE